MRIFFRAVVISFSILFLVYLIWPFGPKSISDFSPLPFSSKSTLSGDTVEVPNVAAYYSNNYRDMVIKYYRNEYQYFTKFFFPPLRLNHPPEDAFVAVKDQTQSTYLEEYSYPLRGTLYVNGLEPFDQTTKQTRFAGATYFDADGQKYETKVTLRFYPTSLASRLVVWLGINIFAIIIFKMVKGVILK
jgi:hypothetical protein